MIPQQKIKALAKINDFRCQLLLAAFYIFIVGIWSLSIAFNNAPDESTHFFLLEFLTKLHTLPAASDPHEAFTGLISGHTWQQGEFWYHGLPFPHILGAMLTTQGFSDLLPAEFSYLAARSFNWLLGGVFICAIFRTARSTGCSLTISLLIAVSISLIPQVTFVFSYLNSDGYGISSIAILLSTLVSFTNSPTRKRALYLGIAIGLMLLAKLYFLPALVFAAITITAQRILKNKEILAHLPTTIITALVVATPMLLTVYLNYGEISGVSGQIDFVNLHKSNPAAGYGTCYLFCNGEFINHNNLTSWLGLTLTSYFSVTGWMNTFIPSPYYILAGLIFLSVALCSLVQMRKLNKKELLSDMAVEYTLPVIMILGLFPAITLLSLIASQNSLPQPQGRYLFVTIPFLGLLIALTTKRLVARSGE